MVTNNTTRRKTRIDLIATTIAAMESLAREVEVKEGDYTEKDYEDFYNHEIPLSGRMVENTELFDEENQW